MIRRSLFLNHIDVCIEYTSIFSVFTERGLGVLRENRHHGPDGQQSRHVQAILFSQGLGLASLLGSHGVENPIETLAVRVDVPVVGTAEIHIGVGADDHATHRVDEVLETVELVEEVEIHGGFGERVHW